MLCYQCREIIPKEKDKIVLGLLKGRSTKEDYASIVFHVDCFHDIAGDEYIVALIEMRKQKMKTKKRKTWGFMDNGPKF